MGEHLPMVNTLEHGTQPTTDDKYFIYSTHHLGTCTLYTITANYYTNYTNTNTTTHTTHLHTTHALCVTTHTHTHTLTHYTRPPRDSHYTTHYTTLSTTPTPPLSLLTNDNTKHNCI